MLNRLQKVGLNGFFLTLLIMILIAYLVPGFGADHSPVPWAKMVAIGNALIFFFYGVKLDPQQLKSAIGKWKLHLVIQLTTFLVFPLIVWFVFLLMGKPAGVIWLGVMYLAALPSTVSSSVVMVNIARGNVPAAIFNASISSLVGITITPLWMEVFMDHDGSSQAFEFIPTISKLGIQILIPFFLGLLMHGQLKIWAKQYGDQLKLFDQGVILTIVFTSFSNAFFDNMFDGMPATMLGFLAIGMAVLFLLVISVMNGIARQMKLPFEDRVTLMFCGSKKSLVHGAIMGSVLFPDPAVLGIVLLPLMLYHSLQLLMGSALAGYFSRQEEYI
ncbi:bile acid:sodium symporter family protein [Echinicola salinicaeni]|uniref:bile acid:sodium symporter family protein n=1 Tax=Echinicola salinicaeni TaxID=2762757 RepID=UPI00293BC617|nr:bile acid:sodium symporter family protein [Echinicola salinicaeni]